ncbi:MAG: FCD domain-containing protein, partial [Bacteroidota bacterium]
FVMELSTIDAKEIYDLMGVLEGEAVQNSTYNPEQLKELQQINDSFIKATNAREMLEFDRMFHEKLIENYSNNYARGIIDQLRIRISLYDYAFWNETQKKESIEIHENIIAQLKKDDIRSAVKLLKHNWSIGIPFIIENFEK